MDLLFNEEKTTRIARIAFFITLISSIIGYFFLPKEIAVQFNSDGISNTMPRLFYLFITNLISFSMGFSKKSISFMFINIVLLLLNFFVLGFNIFLR